MASARMLALLGSALVILPATAFIAVQYFHLQPPRGGSMAGTVPRASMPAQTPDAAELAALGKAMFFDPTLSASGRQSCASCHDPDHGYGPPNALAVQLGGERLDRQGRRAAPSLAYHLNRTPKWHKIQVSSLVEQLTETDSPPSGGLMWDGRFNALHEQASAPLLDPDEMANANPDTVVARLARAPYAARFRAVFGEQIFENPKQAFASAMLALERFQLDDPSFHRYDSKFDAYLDGKATLTPAEMRGLRLFSDPAKGNCAACHVIDRGADGSHPLLTDYQFAALGVPRNPEIDANADPAYYDLGLCGPKRTDQSAQTKYCGMFKTPTLRNTALRGAWFHNGRFHKLEDVVRFYVERDIRPERWYGRDASGKAMRYDDLPPALHANIDDIDAPMDRKHGDRPALNAAEIRDVVTFLRTLNDGWKPAS